jgi:hypothetical protein
MPVYAATGKLGGGKTLWAVKMAFEYLAKGLPVATNVDLIPEKVFSAWKDQSFVNLKRVPDTPSRTDLDALGIGNSSNDESKNGLLVLDECGTMLNARSYQDSGRKDVINWFLHARKLGWDIIFVVQDMSIIDKQIRVALIEYLVTCRRFDRYKIPFLTMLGIRISMPRIHFAIVRYGIDRNSMVSHRDFYRGTHLFEAYNTKQLLMNGASFEAVATVLSPWHLKGRFMKLSKIVLTAVKGTAASFFFFGLFVSYLVLVHGLKYSKPLITQETITPVFDLTGVVSQPDGSFVVLDKNGKTQPVRKFETKNGQMHYFLNDGKPHGLEQLK